MAAKLKIDFVSDVSCPWCAIGLSALDAALQRLLPGIEAELHFQPFELNPHMPPGGQDITEHIAEKYGSSPEQQARSRESIRQRGAEVGFVFDLRGRSRIYNTFDAHRLLHWAELEYGAVRQGVLKKSLLKAYFTDGLSPASHEVLLDVVELAGLDRDRASAVLASDQFADASMTGI
jgi:predicted DsbA family dithiol-disulfide isomerase